MHAYQKRRERWEFENQQHLEKSLQVLQHWIHRQIEVFTALLSFALYVLYKGSLVLSKAHKDFWSPQREIDRRLADAEQQRLKLGLRGSQWLK